MGPPFKNPASVSLIIRSQFAQRIRKSIKFIIFISIANSNSLLSKQLCNTSYLRLCFGVLNIKIENN